MANIAVLRGTSGDLSKLICISQRRINKLAEDGIITREPSKDFILPKAIAEYYSYKYESPESVDFGVEKALHERAKRQLAEFEVRKREHELHEARDVEAVLSEMLINLRNNLLGLPAKMASQLSGKSKDDIEEILRKEIEFTLLEIKDYTPSMFDGADDDDSP